MHAGHAEYWSQLKVPWEVTMTNTELIVRLYSTLEALAPEDDAQLQDLLEEAAAHLDDAVPKAYWRGIDEELPNPDIEQWVVVYTKDAEVGEAPVLRLACERTAARQAERRCVGRSGGRHALDAAAFSCLSSLLIGIRSQPARNDNDVHAHRARRQRSRAA